MRSSISLVLSVLLPIASSTTSSKRGLVYVPSKYPSDDQIWISSPSDLTWYYNYGSMPSASYIDQPQLEFVPMLFGSPSDPDTDTSFYDAVKTQIKNGANVTYVLGFNEPDGSSSTGGSSLAVDTAVKIWQNNMVPLREMGVKIGAPAVTGAQSGFTWLANFFQTCGGNCTVDFIPVHWYGDFQGIASHIGQVMGTYPNQTVWVTEYALPDASLTDSDSFYTTTAQYLDRLGNITRYSYFGSFRSDVSNVGPNAAMLTQKGKLTDIGSEYLGRGPTGNKPKGGVGRLVISSTWSLLLVLATSYSLL